MNKCDYLGLSVLELSKIILYLIWYDYVIPKYDEKENICYMDRGSSNAYIKIGDIHKDIAKDVETRFDTLHYELDRLLPKGKNKNGIKKMELN